MISNIVWATGYYSDYKWIKVDSAINNQGQPIHRSGISPIDGLFYIGLPWQRNRSSALLGGVGKDAKFISEQLKLDKALPLDPKSNHFVTFRSHSYNQIID